jgi:predicted ATPase
LLRQSFDAGSLQVGELDLNGPIVDIGTARDALYQGFDRQQLHIGLGVQSGKETAYFDWVADAPEGADVLKLQHHPQGLDLKAITLFGRGFQFLRADRITPSVTFPKSQHAVTQQRFLGARGEYTTHYLQKFGDDPVVDALRRHSREKHATSLLAQVNAWMQDLSPGVRVETATVPMTDLVRLVYTFRGEKAAYGDALRATNVGFGLTHVLPVITACLSAEPGSLLIIENPEAQLHPRGQAALGQLMAATAAGGVQLIVETHSDHVLNGIRLAVKNNVLDCECSALHFFSRAPGSSSSFETPVLDKFGKLSFWPDGFFDQWERSLDQLLSAREQHD